MEQKDCGSVDARRAQSWYITDRTDKNSLITFQSVTSMHAVDIPFLLRIPLILMRRTQAAWRACHATFLLSRGLLGRLSTRMAAAMRSKPA